MLYCITVKIIQLCYSLLAEGGYTLVKEVSFPKLLCTTVTRLQEVFDETWSEILLQCVPAHTNIIVGFTLICNINGHSLILYIL